MTDRVDNRSNVVEMNEDVGIREVLLKIGGKDLFLIASMSILCG